MVLLKGSTFYAGAIMDLCHKDLYKYEFNVEQTYKIEKDASAVYFLNGDTDKTVFDVDEDDPTILWHSPRQYGDEEYLRGGVDAWYHTDAKYSNNKWDYEDPCSTDDDKYIRTKINIDPTDWLIVQKMSKLVEFGEQRNGYYNGPEILDSFVFTNTMFDAHIENYDLFIISENYIGILFDNAVIGVIIIVHEYYPAIGNQHSYLELKSNSSLMLPFGDY